MPADPKLDPKRDERHRIDKKIDALRKRDAKLEKQIKAIRADRRDLGTERGCIDGATTWRGLRAVLLYCRGKGSWEGVVNAADRTGHADDCGDKLSQAELYAMFLNGTGNPANPPGTGSHEGINGGNGGTPAFQTMFKVGAKLPWWAWGLDVSMPDQLLADCKRFGFKVFRPHMPREPWHVNFSENPVERLIKLGAV